MYQVFASGYVALIRRTCDKKLAVVATGDADNPLRYGRRIGAWIDKSVWNNMS